MTYTCLPNRPRRLGAREPRPNRGAWTRHQNVSTTEDDS